LGLEIKGYGMRGLPRYDRKKKPLELAKKFQYSPTDI
jgi:hypothetical protein